MAGAVSYHYDQFPPTLSDLGTLIRPLSSAAAALARYDQMLRGMHDSGILLAPLRSQEAVVSSRMEGTISTLDEVLRYEADQEDEENPRTDRYRSEAIEVYLYSRALRAAQAAVKDGAPVSAWMIRAAHRELLSFGRGAAMSPGEFRTEQNFLVDGLRRRVLFIPISPERLNDGLEKLFAFINNDDWEILIRTALAHLEFEALHPFKDGNGRIGRMLIPLMLWKSRAITEPYLYISQYLEERRDEYIDRLREVSASGAWTAWVIFFLQALEAQATQNLQKAEEIRALYATMKDNFRKELSSQWSTQALDFMFTRPIFRNNVFTAKAGIPPATAHRFTRSLTDASLLKTLVPAAGRRPALYAFEPLLAIVRG
jgi:Fic family protein